MSGSGLNCTIIFLVRMDQLWLWAMVGMVGGLVLFYRGFRILQCKRLILNTPTSKIRSASLGLVEVSGLATGPYLINAPITGKACYYYRTVAWELRKTGKNQEWRKAADESLHVPFYLDDNTGLLLVNPQGAETDLHRDFREEYGNSFISRDEIPEGVRGFMLRYGVSGEHKIRIEEYCIKPHNALFVLGTLAENPGVEVGPRPLKTQAATRTGTSVNGDSNCGPIQATTGAFVPILRVQKGEEREVIYLSGNRRPLRSTEMTQQGKIAAALLKAGISNSAAWSAAGIDEPSAAVALATSRAVSGTASRGASASPARALEQFDLHPKVVLMKGENSPTFFISWRSKREVVTSMGWKAIACIWGGPALTLVSVYILLAHFDWL